MPSRTSGALRPAVLAPWLVAGAIAALAYALWPQTPVTETPVNPKPAPQAAGSQGLDLSLPEASAPVTAWIAASNALMDHGQFAAAAQGYSHVLQTDSLNVPIWVDRGACRHAQGDFTGALSDFRRALTLAPEHPTAHFNLGIVFLSLGQADSAKPHFNYVIAAAPGSPEAERARSLLAPGSAK